MLNNWLRASSSVDGSAADTREAMYAARTWSLIQESPSSVVLVRGADTTLSAQTFRVTMSTGGNARKGESNAESQVTDAVLFGVKNHPDSSVADANIRRGDRFSLDGQMYRVTGVIVVAGGVQARAEMIS